MRHLWDLTESRTSAKRRRGLMQEWGPASWCSPEAAIELQTGASSTRWASRISLAGLPYNAEGERADARPKHSYSEPQHSSASSLKQLALLRQVVQLCS